VGRERTAEIDGKKSQANSCITKDYELGRTLGQRATPAGGGEVPKKGISPRTEKRQHVTSDKRSGFNERKTPNGKWRSN